MFLKGNKLYHNYDFSEFYIGLSGKKTLVKNLNLNRKQYVYSKTLFVYYYDNVLELRIINSEKNLDHKIFRQKIKCPKITKVFLKKIIQSNKLSKWLK